MLAHQMPPRHDTRRNTVGGDNNGNGVPPYIQLVIEEHAQLIQLLTQNQNNNNNNNNPPPPPPVDMLTRFLRLNPQRFSSSPEPIVVDGWLRAVNRNLERRLDALMQRGWGLPHICWRVLLQLGGTITWSLIPLLPSHGLSFRMLFVLHMCLLVLWV